MGEELTRELPNGPSFEERLFARFDAMEVRFDGRFDRIDARLDGIDVRLDGVDARLDGIDVRLDGIDARLDGLDARVKILEAKALDTKPIWERALAEILEIRNGVENLNRKMDVLTLDMMQLRADQRRVEKRMDDLESRAQ
jgi:chromosome segregation ATPase